MRIFNSIKEKRQQNIKNDICNQSREYIIIDEYKNQLFIYFKRCPIIPIDEKWTSKQILDKLKEIRSYYKEIEEKEYIE